MSGPIWIQSQGHKIIKQQPLEPSHPVISGLRIVDVAYRFWVLRIRVNEWHDRFGGNPWPSVVWKEGVQRVGNPVQAAGVVVDAVLSAPSYGQIGETVVLN